MDKINSKDLKKLINFLEEFSWISKKYNSIDIQRITNGISELEYASSNDKSFYNIKYKNQEKVFLIGCLPSLLMDRELFVKNKDLSDFAGIIGVDINQPEKRSRDEIIGKIICSIQDESSKYSTNEISQLIYKLTNDTSIIENMKFEKRLLSDNYNWNDAIRNLFLKDN